MPDHYCSLCNYSSCDFSNYYRHMKTKKHLKKVHADGNAKKNDLQIPLDTDPSLPCPRPNHPDPYTREIKTTIKCNHCSMEFSRKCNLTQHLKVCGKKKEFDANQRIDILESRIKEVEEAYKAEIEKLVLNYELNLENQIKEIDDSHKMEIEKLILNYELKLANQSTEFASQKVEFANERANLIQNHVLSRIDDLKDQHYFDRSLINTAGKLVSSQQNTLTFLTNNFKETPPLIEFNDVEALKEYKDKDIIYGEDKELWYVLATQYKDGLDMTNNTKTKYSHKGAKNIVSYLSRFLAHAYKNEEFPEKQQIWSSDTARLVFLFRKKVVENKRGRDKSTIAWVSDKEASELKNIVFVPFKDILLELLVSRRQELNQLLMEEQEDGMNDDEFDKRYEELEYLDDVIEFIKTEMFLRDLIIETCPKFKFQFNIHDQTPEDERKTLKFTPIDAL